MWPKASVAPHTLLLSSRRRPETDAIVVFFFFFNAARSSLSVRCLSGTLMCVSVCLPDPVSSSLVQSVMSMASSHSQHSHISTDTMSSMSGSYLAGGDGEPGPDDGGEGEAGDGNRDAFMESRAPSQQDGVSPVTPGGGGLLSVSRVVTGVLFLQEFSQEPKGNSYSLVEERDSEVRSTPFSTPRCFRPSFRAALVFSLGKRRHRGRLLLPVQRQR